jgi:hypothetical protein
VSVSTNYVLFAKKKDGDTSATPAEYLNQVSKVQLQLISFCKPAKR